MHITPTPGKVNRRVQVGDPGFVLALDEAEVAEAKREIRRHPGCADGLHVRYCHVEADAGLMPGAQVEGVLAAAVAHERDHGGVAHALGNRTGAFDIRACRRERAVRLVDDANIVEGVREAPEITRDLGEWDSLLDDTSALVHAAEHEQRIPSPELRLHNGGLVACGAGELHRSGGSRY